VKQTIIWDVFDYIFEADRRRMGRIKPLRTYRNPIFLAREWAEAMESGDFRSQRAFVRAIGLSQARVSQMLSILRLCPDAQATLEAFGDPLYSPKITERKLRPIVKLPEKKQEIRIKEMI
jgi:DNA-binding transcriptional regulator YdaS (Cro superfamily)